MAVFLPVNMVGSYVEFEDTSVHSSKQAKRSFRASKLFQITEANDNRRAKYFKED